MLNWYETLGHINVFFLELWAQLFQENLDTCQLAIKLEENWLRDHEMRHKKTSKNAFFGLKIDEFIYHLKSTWRVKLKFVHNVGA